MFTSRILRNIGANKLMNESAKSDRTMLYGTGALMGLIGLVSWVGYQAEGVSKEGRDSIKEFQTRAMNNPPQ
ncbi:hypothetical protein BDZ97DRAFT_1918508 [Flammula alnicola]|nr:hypothetical protein BDZ97DRAFT_1918508 [Flammula alnicola]